MNRVCNYSLGDIFSINIPEIISCRHGNRTCVRSHNNDSITNRNIGSRKRCRGSYIGMLVLNLSICHIKTMAFFKAAD